MIKLAWGEPMEILEMLTGKFIQEPHYFNKFEFSCQIFFVHFAIWSENLMMKGLVV